MNSTTEQGYSLQYVGDGSYRVNGVFISPVSGKYITGIERDNLRQRISDLPQDENA